VGDVLGVRRGKPTCSKEPGVPAGPPSVLSANVFQICSVLEIPQFHLAGRCGPRGWVLLASKVVDHLETFCLPKATLRSHLETWRAGR
jgi:hypothetical protein